MAIMEIIMKGVDQVSPVMDKIKGKTGGTTAFMEKNWKMVGVAAVAAATGIEMLARANAPLVELTRRLSANLGITDKAMKDLVISTSNVTFPLKDVLTLMELGTKQGLKSAESLKKYAEFWDMVGDATGESATELGKAAVSLKALGISAGEEGKALKAFGFIQESTTMKIGEFINSIGRLAPEMKELNMGVNEAAVILGIMQREFGMTSRVAMQEFRTAVTSAEGDVDKLKDTLGITGEMFDEYTRKVEESSDVIEENAKRNNELYTPMQKIQHALGEMKYAMSGYIETAAKFAPALYLVGPAMKAFSLGAKGIDWVMKGNLIPTLISATTKVWAFTTAIFANPLTWWVLGIAAVITAIVLLYKNWEKVTEFISRSIDWIGEKIKWLGDAFKWVAEKLGIYKEKTTEIIEETDNLKESVDGVNESIDGLTTTEGEATDASILLAEESKKLGESLEGVGDKAEGASDAIKVYADDVGENYIQLAIKAGDSGEDFYAFWEAEAKRTAKEIIDVNKEVEESTPGPKPSNLYKIVDSEGNTIGIQSGNILSQAQVDEGISLVKIHGGGMIRTTIPGGEGLALLRDREIVRTEEESGWKTNQIVLNIKEGAFKITSARLDERTIKDAGKWLFDEFYSQCRANNIILQRG